MWTLEAADRRLFLDSERSGQLAENSGGLVTSWEDKRAHALARLDRMRTELDETADPGHPDTIRRRHRIKELRRQSLAFTPEQWAATPDIPDL